MDVLAKMTTKGQITVPKEVREALDLHAGDSVLVRLEKGRAVLTKNRDFIELAGSVETPPDVRGLPWDEVRAEAWRRVWRKRDRR